jgi:molybdopterin-guanine dinucleotide biosynthesis protein A
MDSLKVLILAGGHSSRMGSPKHLLPLADKPLYIHLIDVLHEALPGMTTCHISLAGRSTIDNILRDESAYISSADNSTLTAIKLKIITDDATQDIGPAAGLLAAHNYDEDATWLVIACDYPLLQAAAVSQLINSYKEPVTCFKNGDGFSEPLLGIWSPQALRSLKDNVAIGRLGPSNTLKRLDGNLIVPANEEWLVNVNTKQEWQAAKARMQGPQSSNEL